MKLKLNLFLCLIFIFGLFANAQRPVPFKSGFTYFQPPSNFLAESGTFSVNASLVYEEEVKEQLISYEVEMEEWKALPAKEKLKRRAIDKGNLPENKYFPTIHGEERITRGIKIEGLEISDDAAANVTITVNKPITSSSARKVDIDGNKLWKIDVNTNISIDIVITDDKGLKEAFSFEGSHTETDAENFEGKLAGKGVNANTQQKVEKRQFPNAERKALDNVLSNIGAFLSNRYGLLNKNMTTQIYTLRAKKHNYDALTLAARSLVGGYDLQLQPENAEKFEGTLLKAIDVFNKELEEYIPMNKKARISDAAATFLYLNIAEAHLWLQDFAKCKQALGEYDNIQVLSKKSAASGFAAAANDVDHVAHSKRLNGLVADLEMRYSQMK